MKQTVYRSFTFKVAASTEKKPRRIIIRDETFSKSHEIPFVDTAYDEKPSVQAKQVRHIVEAYLGERKIKLLVKRAYVSGKGVVLLSADMETPLVE